MVELATHLRWLYHFHILRHKPNRGNTWTEPRTATVMQLRWSPHWVIPTVTCKLCVRCGEIGRRRDPERLAGTSCPGVREPTARMRVMLIAARRAGLCRDLPPAWTARLEEVVR